MSSCLSIVWDALQVTLLDISDIVERLHTVGVEFTVKRENKRICGCEVTLQYLFAEQIPDETGEKTLGNIEKIPKEGMIV